MCVCVCVWQMGLRFLYHYQILFSGRLFTAWSRDLFHIIFTSIAHLVQGRINLTLNQLQFSTKISLSGFYFVAESNLRGTQAIGRQAGRDTRMRDYVKMTRVVLDELDRTVTGRQLANKSPRFTQSRVRGSKKIEA